MFVRRANEKKRKKQRTIQFAPVSRSPRVDWRLEISKLDWIYLFRYRGQMQTRILWREQLTGARERPDEDVLLQRLKPEHFTHLLSSILILGQDQALNVEQGHLFVLLLVLSGLQLSREAVQLVAEHFVADISAKSARDKSIIHIYEYIYTKLLLRQRTTFPTCKRVTYANFVYGHSDMIGENKSRQERNSTRRIQLQGPRWNVDVTFRGESTKWRICHATILWCLLLEGRT